MAQPPTVLDVLVGGGRTPEELYELLGRAGCLTSRGQADPAGTVAAMQRAADAYQLPHQVGIGPWAPGSGHTCTAPSLWEAIEHELTDAGLVDMRAFQDGTDPQNRYGPVDAIIAEVQAMTDARGAGATANGYGWLWDVFDEKRRTREGTIDPNGIPCPACRRALPDNAMHCVWCGQKLSFVCSCGGW